MMDSIESGRRMTAAKAHEVITASRDAPPRSVYRSCSGCHALVTRGDLVEHERWHQALDVLAARVLGLSS